MSSDVQERGTQVSLQNVLVAGYSIEKYWLRSS